MVIVWGGGGFPLRGLANYYFFTPIAKLIWLCNEVTSDIYTTIIATANPRGLNEIDQKEGKDILDEVRERKSLKGRYPITAALVDRFAIILFVTDEFEGSKERAAEYSRLRRIARDLHNKRPYKYSSFLSKYIFYVKQKGKATNVTLTPETQFLFDEYYSELKVNPDIPKSTRLNEVLYKFVNTWAKMYGVSEVSTKMFTEIKQQFKTIVENYVNIIGEIIDPYDLIKENVINMIRLNPDKELRISEIIETLCQTNSFINSVLGERKQIGRNKHLQKVVSDIKEENKGSIIIVKNKPVTFKYISKTKQEEEEDKEEKETEGTPFD